MNRKQLRQFVRTRATVAFKRLEEGFFLQKCMGGYKYKAQMEPKSTDLELAAAVTASEKEIQETLGDLIALQAVCEQGGILGSIILRRHKRLVRELDIDAAAINRFRDQQRAQKKALEEEARAEKKAAKDQA